MSAMGHKSANGACGRVIASLAIALAIAMLPGQAHAWQKPPDTGARVSLDRVVAIVNGDLILASDVDAEQRFAAFQPFSDPKPISQDELINRLIDRALIQQQMALQPETPITDADVDAELTTLRKSIPKCAAYHCDTDAGWEKFVADQGFDMQEMKERWAAAHGRAAVH